MKYRLHSLTAPLRNILWIILLCNSACSMAQRNSVKLNNHPSVSYDTDSLRKKLATAEIAKGVISSTETMQLRKVYLEAVNESDYSGFVRGLMESSILVSEIVQSVAQAGITLVSETFK